MANLLFLVHRLPYPPNKGDKVRSYHLLKHLVARHRVFLATFVDDPDDLRHLPTVRNLCADMHAEPLDPRWARLRSVSAFLSGEPLSLPYYRSEPLRQWVAGVRARHAIDATVVFSSVMAEYAVAAELPPGHPLLVDFVDVDSEKWAQYATQRRWPMSWVYAREGRCLLAYERALARRATRSFFVADKESDLLPLGPGGGAERADDGQWRRCRFLLSRSGTRQPVRPRRPAARVHRRHGLLAQHRRSHLVCDRGAARAAGPLAGAEIRRGRA